MLRDDELFTMFKYPSMIKTAAFCAATFGLMAVIFKNSIVFIPEVTEVRLCNILAVFYGLYFGPAGAWGCAVGNIIGDLGGSLTVLSFVGFMGNFLSAYLPYKIWGVFGARYGELPCTRPSLSCKNALLRLLLILFCTVLPCAASVAWLSDLTGYMNAPCFCGLLCANNFGASILGIALFVALSYLPEKSLPYWRELMHDERNRTFQGSHLWLCWACFLICLFTLAITAHCMASNGWTLRSAGPTGQTVMIVYYCIFSFVSLGLGLACHWKPVDKDAPLEL